MKVADIGPPDAKIMLIGEAPGREEEKVGYPFANEKGAGGLLRRMCRATGFPYNRCYVTNVVNERPPNNKFDYFYEDKSRKIPKDSLTDAWFKLGDKIKRIKPNIIVCLGAEALRAVTGEKGITEWRGTILEAYECKVLATFHPASVLRKYSQRPIVELDLRRALKESTSPEYKYDNPTIIVSPNIQQVIDYIHNAVTDCNSIYEGRVAFDIETVGERVRSIALARYNSKHRKNITAISIPFLKMSSSPNLPIPMTLDGNKISVTNPQTDATSYWSAENEVMVLDLLAELFNNKDIELVGQNSIIFDSPMIKDEFLIDTTNHYMDTMHAWHVLYPELPMGLSFLVSVLTDYPNYWTKKVTTDDISEWTYNAWDSVATLDISYTIEKELNETGLAGLYFNHVHPLAISLAEAAEYGVLFDQEECARIRVEQEAKLAKISSRLSEIACSDFNPNSPKQVAELLYDDLKFPKIYNKGRLTTDEEAINKLRRKYPDEEGLRLIVQYRKVSKLISTYLNVQLHPDGRVRTSYNPSGTKGARISSSKKLTGYGLNLQNIPVGKKKGVENIRHLFIAPDGKVLIKADLSQAESMAVAWILRSFGDDTMYDIFQEGIDIHKWRGTSIFDTTYNAITKNMRDIAKIDNHSGNYMAGPNVLMKTADQYGIEGIDLQLAKHMNFTRHKAIPGLRKWWRWVEMQLRTTRVLTTCFGRKRQFFGRIDDTTLRDAVAWEPQSVVGDVCNTIFQSVVGDVCNTIFWGLCRTWINDSGIQPILQVHDEVVIECPHYRKTINDVVDSIKRIANIPLTIRPAMEPLTIPIEIKVGKNWRDMKEL
jgi:uracil-DNA glycosylase family 4